MSERIASADNGIVLCGHTKAAIIGCGPSRDLAPWQDDSWCFYALNEIPQRRFDRHFELHPRSVQNDRELAWLAQCPTPCYVLDLAEWEGTVPNAVQFPLERVLDVTRGRRYFTCTFAFQIALAITEGAHEIGLWGVDLDWGTERERLVEKPCVEYWIGLAEGRGIAVTLPRVTPLCSRQYLYGYAYHKEKAAIDAVCHAMHRLQPDKSCLACEEEKRH